VNMTGEVKLRLVSTRGTYYVQVIDSDRKVVKSFGSENPESVARGLKFAACLNAVMQYRDHPRGDLDTALIFFGEVVGWEKIRGLFSIFDEAKK